jgi:hypothetical protein
LSGITVLVSHPKRLCVIHGSLDSLSQKRHRRSCSWNWTTLQLRQGQLARNTVSSLVMELAYAIELRSRLASALPNRI